MAVRALVETSLARTSEDRMIDLSEIAAWIIVWCVFAPLIAGVLVAIFYEIRYRAPLANYRHLEKGLFR